MPKIIAAAHALPPYAVPQAAVKDEIVRLFHGKIPDIQRLITVFDNSRIQTRQFMMPLEWYLNPRSSAERNRIYKEKGLALMKCAAAECLTRSGWDISEVDHVIFVSSTGHATPTMDAHLINILGLRQDVTRLPVWGLGCAGGAAGIARAYDHCLGNRKARTLVVALECCSLTFADEDVSKKNLVATSLFSDGCAAVAIAGDDVCDAGVSVMGRGSHLFRDGYRIMGWDFEDDGMRLVLSARLPAVVREGLPRIVQHFLEIHGLTRESISHFITHPGGAKVIDAYREALDLADADLSITEDVLRNHGNISSVSVLIVLEKWLANGGAQRRGHGLLSAFGPGFSAEMVLLEV